MAVGRLSQAALAALRRPRIPRALDDRDASGCWDCAGFGDSRKDRNHWLEGLWGSFPSFPAENQQAKAGSLQAKHADTVSLGASVILRQTFQGLQLALLLRAGIGSFCHRSNSLSGH